VTLADACRNRALDRSEQTVQVVGKIARGDVRGNRRHAAAEVDADRGRDDGAVGWDDRADGGAHADMGIGHERDVARNDGQARRAMGLSNGSAVRINGPRQEVLGNRRWHVTSVPARAANALRHFKR
jgi:hypothetical protein